jgi:hypothetical protein
MPDTTANRQAFGTAGAAETGYPQIRHLHASDAFTRATLAVVTGPAGGDKAEAEQKLLDRMLVEQPQAFGPDRVWVMDRNFPGVPRIVAMLATGTHVLIRLKSDIRLDRIGEFTEDGRSYHARLSGGGATLTVRVIEYHVNIDDQTTGETFCLITDLLDHQMHPAELLANAYRWRWDGSETALREAKSTINGAGPATGAILRSTSPTLIRQEHPAWIVATELTHAATRSAAALATPFAKGPRTGQPVHARHLSFTTTRRTLITSIRTGTATASLPAATRRHPPHRPPDNPGHHRHRPPDHRPTPTPPPQDQNQTAVRSRPPRHHHPHRPRHRAHLRHHRRLTNPSLPTAPPPPGMEPGAPGQTTGPPPSPQPDITHRTHHKDQHRLNSSPPNSLISLALGPARSGRVGSACYGCTARVRGSSVVGLG